MHRLERYYVPTGSYYVGKSTPLILKASLGTCVGVALFDPKNKIGGLIHLLLDKAPLHVDNQELVKYATTGMPVFFKALLALGASPKHIIAWVAGGALVGPMHKYDLEFDVGGRTTECVVDFLAEQQICIKKSETGGLFTCALNLNMQTWECTIEPIGFENFTPKDHIRISSADEINDSIQKLLPIPQVALKILRLINEDDYDIALLSAEIRQDQVLSARTLKLCNSAFFKKRTKIETMNHALAYLGQKVLVKFIISSALNPFFDQTGMGYSLCKGGLYHHAVGTAIIAEKIAEKTGKTDTSLAYTGGLLHDIGKVVLDQFVQGSLPLFYRQLFEEGQYSPEAEKNILGIDHMDAGSLLAQQWFFPESLKEIIKYHHMPENAVHYKDLVHIIYLADLLMSRFNVGLEFERLNTGMLAQSLDKLELSIKSFQDIVDMIPVKALELSPRMVSMDENL